MKKEDFKEAWRLLRRQVNKFRVPWIDQDAHGERDPFRTLISCIISLRTQDKVTEEASKRLFLRASNPEQMTGLSPQEIAGLIYPAGFYKTKAQRIYNICLELACKYQSKVPDNLDELLRFKGIGRKTANLVITVGYNRPGICVDTHVHRIPNRWGLINTKNPLKTEYALKEVLPLRYWKDINRYLVAFGQNICKPLSPYCSRCSISIFCEKIDVIKSR